MKNYLVVVDMQNDFITGPLGTKEAQDVEKVIAYDLEDICKQNKIDHIYLTCDTHSYDYLSTDEGKRLPIEHCIECTPGWYVSTDITKAIIESKIPYTFLNKKKFGYDWSSRADFFVDDKINVIIVGVCTDICVISNALILKSLDNDINVTVYSNLCAGTTPENHLKALDIMKNCHINII